MTEKVQGTITLDGLIEGRLGEDDAAERLREWTDFVGQLGVKFNLDVTGGQFSLLPDDTPQSTAGLGDAPERSIADALEQLVAALPEAVRPNVFSTLRSAEYRPGEEVQAIYAIGVDGKVDVQKRVVAAQTVAPPEPMDLKTKIRMVISGLVVAMAVLFVASFFVDFSSLWGEAVDSMTSMDPEQMEIDATAFGGVVALGEEMKISGRRLQVSLKRGPGFPQTVADLEEAIQTTSDARRRMALEALLTGYIRVELFDKDGKYYATSHLRIRALLEADEVPVIVPLHPKKLTSRVVFTF